MKNLLIIPMLIFLVSCNSKSDHRVLQEEGFTILPDGSRAENAVDGSLENIETTKESIKEPTETDISTEETTNTYVPSQFITTILKQLRVQPKQVYGEFVVQKMLPHDPNSTVVVIPTVASQEYEWEVFTLNSHILVVDSETGKIKQQFYEKENWYSDAVRIDEISIDTANYKVTEGKRAFGIVLSYIGASRPNPYNSKTLSLFIQEGDKLVRILDAFEIYSYGGEWDLRCTGEFTMVDKILIVDKKKHNGFFDINVRGETTILKTFEKGEDDCNEKKTTQKFEQSLQYYNTYKLYNETR